MDLGATAIKRYYAFPKAPAFLEPHPSDCLVTYPEHSLEEFYPSTEMPSVHSAAPADWVIVRASSFEQGQRKFKYILANLETDFFIAFLHKYLVWLSCFGYSISSLVGYVITNPVYTYISNIYSWLVLWHINPCRLLNAKSCLYIYIRYMICVVIFR